MTGSLRHFLLLFITALTALAAGAQQRRVNPVKPPRPGEAALAKKPKEIDRTRLAERLDAQGNIILVDTVTGLEFVDSAAMAEKPRNLYPLWESVDIGVDIWDPVMRLLGQHYGIGSAYARLSLHNRFFPLAEVGLGRADINPDGSNFTFRSPTAPFFKIGADYNIFYNNSPAYTLLAGLRYGFTSFRWGVDNVSVPGSYWDDPSTFSIPLQNATAGFLEISLGVRVKIVGPISAGWQFKFRSILHESKNIHGKPLYIPGFGKRGSGVSGAFSIIYTIPLNRRAPGAVDNDSGTSPVAEPLPEASGDDNDGGSDDA